MSAQSGETKTEKQPSAKLVERFRRIAGAAAGFEGQGLDARYLGFFRCFNDGEFYEAHEVLESLWLEDRQGPNGAFYKGLIQLAGAFVHLQKNRPGPAAALFRLADANLARYGVAHDRLDLQKVRGLIAGWLSRLNIAGNQPGSLADGDRPELQLEG